MIRLGYNEHLVFVIYIQPKDHFSQEWPLQREKQTGTGPGTELASRMSHLFFFFLSPFLSLSRSKYKPALGG